MLLAEPDYKLLRKAFCSRPVIFDASLWYGHTGSCISAIRVISACGADIGGCKEQIEKMREVVELPMLHPEKFVQLGIDPPKGVLCYGPPGVAPLPASALQM